MSSRAIRQIILILICAMPFGLCELGGCGPSAPPSTQPQSLSDRQNQALADPMGYKVPPTHDVSGGDTTGFDHKGFNRDVNDFLNP